MNTFYKSFLTTLVTAIIATTASTSLAFANDATSGKAGNLLSYAPQEKFDDGRFGLFNFDDAPLEHSEEHELNDAWLGLSAYSKDGKYLGYIEDAILDINGNVTEIVVSPPEGGIAVQLQIEYASLEEDKVTLSLTRFEFASILTDGEVVLSTN